MGSRKTAKQGETEGAKALGPLLSPCFLSTPILASTHPAPQTCPQPGHRSQVRARPQVRPASWPWEGYNLAMVPEKAQVSMEDHSAPCKL